MEVFVRNLPFGIDRVKFIEEIADVFHGCQYGRDANGSPINFDATIHRPNKHKNPRILIGLSFRTGTVTFPTRKAGEDFLNDFGGDQPRISVKFGNHPRTILFKQSKFPPKPEILARISNAPYLPPEQRSQHWWNFEDSSSSRTNLRRIQFGWECWDNVFSVEWESSLPSLSLDFDDETHQITIRLSHDLSSRAGSDEIIILSSQIQSMYANDSPDEHAILLILSYPVQYRVCLTSPIWEFLALDDSPDVRLRKSALSDKAQSLVAPYTSIAIRAIFSSGRDLGDFRKEWVDATHWRIESYNYGLERRNLFSPDALENVAAWLRQLEWPLAFHVGALMTNWCIDPKELLSLQPDIHQMIVQKGSDFASQFFMHFREELLQHWYSDSTQSRESAKECFERSLAEHKVFESRLPRSPAEDLFECLHVVVTPTRIHLAGPFIEGTNRIVRRYAAHTDSFLRVSFEDESKTKYRFDHDVDGRSFIYERVGAILRKGLTVAGRKFEFLAYSQSALKEHAVWFMSPFHDEKESRWIDAQSIIEDIGTFDPELMRCPARYAARISQAFTTTDTSVEVEAEEIIFGRDIERNKSIFTDGIGTISSALAEDIWGSLRAKKRRGYGGHRPRSRAFQIRFQGSKGMVSVDYKLSGRVLVLRPSMIKFQSNTTTAIEIAGVFSRPGKMFLNRPLIMLLEGLGVPADTFLSLQKLAVKKIWRANTSMRAARSLINDYGLGSSFRLSSTLLHLEKLKAKPRDKFYEHVIRLCVLHSLREIKYKARIPVPGWTLVGVADVHSYLKEGQVFVCIEEENGKPTYLRGPVSVSRSPTIHPGDVQMAFAIGNPPPDSPFAHERLPNTVVFSILGERSLPSMLGGGDLDGDVRSSSLHMESQCSDAKRKVYNVTDYTALHPSQIYEAADYDPARRKTLDKPSTMDDVIDFVLDFMNSDNVGIIATNWLIIADQNGIHDPNCLKLARLHSDAVDFPKTGLPVPMQEVPGPEEKHRRPDWNEPETGFHSRIQVYESTKAIGVLFRDIELPRVYKRRESPPKFAQANEDLDDLDLEFSDRFGSDAGEPDEPVEANVSLGGALRKRVSELVYSDGISRRQQNHLDGVFHEYVRTLRQICSNYSLSWYRHLSEEEAMVGTIKARTSNPRRRKDMIAKLREQTAQLVEDMIFEINGEDVEISVEKQLKVALAAWEMSQSKGNQFGAKSFSWIALISLFEAIKVAEDDDRDRWAETQVVYPQ